MFGDNRNSGDLQNSLLCNGVDCAVEFSNNHVDSLGVCDNGIIEVKECDKTTLLLKATVKVCAKIVDQCNDVVDGRGTNVERESLVVSGMVADCEKPYPSFAQIVIFPQSGQTLKELKEQVIALLDRNCA